MNEKQKQNTRKLIEALRSGDYEQGRGQLKIISNSCSYYCCLGVASEIQNLRTTEDNGDISFVYPVSFLDREVECMYMPSSKWFKETYGFEDIHLFDVQTLPQWNDDRNRSFKEIADLIEKEFFYEEYMAKQEAGD